MIVFVFCKWYKHVQAIIRQILCQPSNQFIIVYLYYGCSPFGRQSAWHLIPAFPQNVSFGYIAQMHAFPIRFYTSANSSRTMPRTESRTNFLETNHSKVPKWKQQNTRTSKCFPTPKCYPCHTSNCYSVSRVCCVGKCWG